MGAPQIVGKGLDLFKTLVFDTAVEAAIAAWAAPVIAIPIIGPIVNDLIMDFANKLYDVLAGGVLFETVLFVDAQHRAAFDTAQTGLKGIAIQYGIDSQQFKDAHAKEKAALKLFGQFNIAH